MSLADRGSTSDFYKMFYVFFRPNILFHGQNTALFPLFSWRVAFIAKESMGNVNANADERNWLLHG